MPKPVYTKPPLVSVVIPCYNYAQFIEEAIGSVVNQTYTNIEIIVINDGSTDDSDDVILGLKNKYKFRYVKQPNQGIVKTRNEGVRLAKGNYLIQLDADDFLAPEYIGKTLSAAQDQKADIVYTQVEVFGRTEFVTNHPEFNLEYLKHDNYIHGSALVHKKVFSNRGYDDYLSDKGNEDWDIFLDACMDGAAAFLVDEPLLKYRKHDRIKSRADAFEGTYNESLVRHHVLSKQNTKHPAEMWYFSPEINMLLKHIEYYQKLTEEEEKNQRLVDELNDYRKRLNRIERTTIYKAYLKLKALSKVIGD